MPEPLDSRRTISLATGESHRQVFRLRWIVGVTTLESGKYTLDAAYDANGLPGNASILRGPVVSNRLEFAFP